MILKLVLVTSLAAAVALSAAGAALAKTYFGVVGPGRTIILKNAQGNKVSQINAGRHTIKVDDKASVHNFHLFGQGRNRKTGVPFVGKKTWTLRFPEGNYRYRCDPHKRTMRGGFRAV
jgi:plastocyanin